MPNGRPKGNARFFMMILLPTALDGILSPVWGIHLNSRESGR